MIVYDIQISPEGGAVTKDNYLRGVCLAETPRLDDFIQIGADKRVVVGITHVLRNNQLHTIVITLASKSRTVKGVHGSN